MTKYPNQEGLNKALNIYRSAMRSFIVCCLEKVHPKGVEELIVDSLNSRAANKFEQDLHLYKGNIEASISINTFPHIIRNRWDDVFEQQFNPYSNVRNVINLIADGRNQCAHLDTEDLDLDYTWTYLFFISDVLSQINRPDAKREIETILDELFPDDTDERIANMTKQLDTAKAEKTDLEKQVKTKSDRLEEVEAEWIACEERLETVSTQLKIAVAGKTVAEERLSDISNRFADVEVEKTELEKRLKVVEAEKAELEKRLPEDKDDEPSSGERVGLPTGKELIQPALEFLSDRGECPRVEIINVLTDYFTLTKNQREKLSRSGKAEVYLRNKGLIERTRTGYYRITSRGLEVLGKNSSLGRNKKTGRAREAPDRYTKRTRVKRTNLPTGKEMEQPTLEFLSDGREYPRIEIINVLTDHFSLTKDQREVLSRSGKVELYLRNNGLIERTKTGYYRITYLGLEVVGEEFT